MEVSPTLPLEKELLPLFTEKAPFQIPAEWKELIAKYGPWLMVIFLPLSLIAMGLGTFASLVSMFSFDFLGALAISISLLSILISILAIKALFDRKRRGWEFSYYSFLLSLLSSIVSFHILSFIIGFLIGGFFLFQIREKYYL